MLRAGPPAPLARGRPLPVLRRRLGCPPRPGRHPAASPALSLRGVQRPLRRPDRHRPGWAPSWLGAVLAGHHRPLRVWVLCLYFIGLNLSNRQIAQELDLSQSDVQLMTEQLRTGLVARMPPARLAGEVEIDEVYVTAGHKGNPAAVAKRGVPAAAAA